MSAKSKTSCYVCDKPATSQEHLPPRSFFPTGYRESLITVPSCDEHNREKSKDDEYIKYILLNLTKSKGSEWVKKSNDESIRGLERALNIFLSQFSEALDLDPDLKKNNELDQAMLTLNNEESSLEERLKALSVAAIITNSKLGIFGVVHQEPESAVGHDGQPAISTAIDRDRLFNFFELLAQGLWYAHHKKPSKKPKYLVFHDLLLPDISNIEKSLSKIYRDNFNKSTSVGENKEIFCYEFFHHSEDDTIVLNMCFFDNVIITAVFDVID